MQDYIIPMMEQISKEQINRAKIEVKFDKICDRVDFLEKILSLNNP